MATPPPRPRTSLTSSPPSSASFRRPGPPNTTNSFRARSITVEASEVEKLISELAGKDLNELIAAGSAKLASVPSGGAGGAAAPAAATGGAAAAAVEKVEEKVEEKEESDECVMFWALGGGAGPRERRSADKFSHPPLYLSELFSRYSDMGFGLL